jgi:hypothetical protein
MSAVDPITGAVTGALGKLAEPAVKDAYEALKALIVRRFGAAGAVAKAVETLEAQPHSATGQAVLAEEITASAAAKDAELLRLADLLAEKVRSVSSGAQTVRQHVSGNHNVVSGTGDITINIDRRGTPDPG